MAETQHQTSMNSDEVKEVLEKLGYSLKDFGNHWRTKAIYRGGDNPTSLQVYKNTGVWRDFVGGDGTSQPLRKLVELTLKTKDPKIIQQYIVQSDRADTVYIAKEKIEMDKIYPEDCLKRLFLTILFTKRRTLVKILKSRINVV